MPVKNVNDLKYESVYTAFFFVQKEIDVYKMKIHFFDHGDTIKSDMSKTVYWRIGKKKSAPKDFENTFYLRAYFFDKVLSEK